MVVLKAGVSNTPPPSSQAAPGTWNLNGMVFDAWLRLNHNTELTITQHPVETGAPISDHCFSNPRRFSFDIGMSDVLKSPSAAGSSTRSINAYNSLVAMQESRQFLTLNCKYGFYRDILIQSINAVDDAQTVYGSRWTITLQRIVVASPQLGTGQISNNPQVTDQTSRGQLSPQSLSQRIIQAGQNWLGGLFSGGN